MKNKIFKGVLLGALSISALAFNSCSDEFLDLKPEGRPTVGEVPVGGFEAQAFGLYSSLRSKGGISDFTCVWTHIIRADDSEKGSTAADGAADGNVFDKFGYVATNGHINSDWNAHYQLIFDCNELINLAVISGDTTAGTLTNIAEAKAIRAFCYFELRRDFGEIPIVLITIDEPQDEYAPKSSVAQVDAQIEKDLIEAAANLPVQWQAAYLGRSTSGFANSLLAKLYLYQNNWAKSLELCERVINSGAYTLSSSYDFEFTLAGNNSKESIFEVQKSYDFPVKYSNNFYEAQGVRGSGIWDLGFGFNVPSEDLIASYEAGDVRKKTTILESGKPDIYNSANLVLPDSPPLAQKYWNGKAYTFPAERTKYANNKNLWENIKFIRYADVILMAAEASNELGQTAKAVGFINRIRNRANLGNSTAVSQLDIKQAIKKERRIEFALEFERFYDLVRWGDATSALAAKGYQDKNKFFPIPQSAIDRSQGILKQNPNY